MSRGLQAAKGPSGHCSGLFLKVHQATANPGTNSAARQQRGSQASGLAAGLQPAAWRPATTGSVRIYQVKAHKATTRFPIVMAPRRPGNAGARRRRPHR